VFGEIIEVFNGKLDILVNNAGITKRHKPEEFPRGRLGCRDECQSECLFGFLAQLAGSGYVAGGLW